MTVQTRSKGVKSSLIISLLLLAFATVHGVEDEPKKPVRKKSVGGFTGATPKPETAASATPKKKSFTADDEPAPTAKKKAPVDADEEPAPAKKKTAASDDAPVKKKAVVADEDAPVVKKKKIQDDDETPAPTKKKSKVSDESDKSSEDAPPKKKTEPEEPTPTPAEKSAHAPAAVLAPEELADFDAQPPRVQQLLTAALELTHRNLTYTYGSDDPSTGGMDCSGAMAYVLRGQGFSDVPRDSSAQYIWARKNGEFFAVVGKSADSFEFKDLQPGDLMFWTGTYETGREVPISHVMLYLGKEKKTGKRVMFGASDGRSYNGVQRWGVSVFDFKMPKADPANPEKSKVDFVGYARIPGLRTESVAVAPTPTPAPAEEAATEDKPPKAEAEPKPKTHSQIKARATPRPKSKRSTSE